MIDVIVLDYGAGNLASVMKGLSAVGAAPVANADPAVIGRAAALVVPGVGHFARTTSIAGPARAAICDAIARGVPVLGICLGLQWLFEGSEEAPGIPGLGVFAGRCFDLGSDRGQTTRGARPAADRRKAHWHGSDPGLTPKVPHVGWNTVDVFRPCRLLEGLGPSTFAYFTHSYAAPVVDDTAAVTTHRATFSAVVERGRVFGAQFHPEKSGEAGLRMLANFVRVAAGCR